jgi:hypothetical protein
MSWIQTRSGRAVSYLVPDPTEITVDDIAVALSRAPRFTGHTRNFYSVAQHCCLVCDIITEACPKDYAAQLWGLLHDAHEAFTGDLSTPLQSAMRELIPAHVPHPLKIIQAKLDVAIAGAFQIDLADIEEAKPIVKRADLIALSTEKAQLMAPAPQDWKIELPTPHKVEIVTLSPGSAEFVWRAYLDRRLKAYRDFLGLPAYEPNASTWAAE